MKQMIGMKTIKSSIGAALAILIAQALGLSFAASAGIITILSIQNTRKESVEIAMRRIGATFIALTIGSILFLLVGYHAAVFGLYLLIFIPIAVRCKVTEGIVPASVLVTHLLGSNEITFSLIGNELALIFVGVAVALVFNIYMPSLEESLITERKTIDDHLYEIIVKMTQALKDEKQVLDIVEACEIVEGALERARKKAQQYSNNAFMHEKSLYEKYFDMRYSQYQVLKYLMKHFENLYMLPIQAKQVAMLMDETARTIKGTTSVEEAMKTLENLRKIFKESDLPKTRNEFENRAMLYQFLTDIEQFLYVKKLFKSGLSDKEIKEYINYYHE